jgi:hypothetical protein
LTIYAVTGILVDPLLKYMAVLNLEVADLWGIVKAASLEDEKVFILRHCKICVPLGTGARASAVP